MNSVTVGLLFSLTGTTTLTEKSQYLAAMFAIEEFNRQNTGLKIDFIVRDIKSDPYEAKKHAAQLAELGVKIFVGGFTSACRRAILPILEEYGCLLIYSMLYEGNESHPNVFYVGEVPKQQIFNLLDYVVNNYGKKIYLIGTDYIYPRTTNQQVHDYVRDPNVTIVGETYVPLGQTNFSKILQDINEIKPDAILSTLVGKSLIHFYQSYFHYSWKAFAPIFSPNVTEVEIEAIGSNYVAGHYSCGGYFQSIQSPSNQLFLESFQRESGEKNVVSFFMINTYIGMLIIFQALNKMKTLNVNKLLNSLAGKQFQSPSGVVEITKNHHVSRKIYIGRANQTGQFDIVWDSNERINTIIEKKVEVSKECIHWEEIAKLLGEETKVAVIVLYKGEYISYLNKMAKDLLKKDQGDWINSEDLFRYYSILKNISRPDYQLIWLKGSQREIKPEGEYVFHTIRTRSELYAKQLELARVVADSDSNVLIMGETGSGKEVMARSIHWNSSRRNGPFISINTGAIQKDLILSELFGYVEGAFTGAKRGGAIGKFEAAHKGTLFLDEIGEMPLELQVVLLRAIEEQKITRIGDVKERTVNVRIIAATNRNLKEEIAFKGSFRSDLFYRLNVFNINIPALHDRKEDISHLSMEFLTNFKQLNEDGPSGFSPRAMSALNHYSWPGNIRELRNVIERSFYLARGEQNIDLNHLPEEFQNAGFIEIQTNSIKDMEKSMIEEVIRQMPNIKKSAEKLGISRSTLYRKMQQYNISK